MVKNLPLLLAMLIVGSSVLTISQTTQLPELLHWALIIIAVVLNIWSAIGLILHVGIQKLSKN
ncbi:hypothetical protein [Oceanobacillus sp. Castelsardo]|uniref:hypothetical protein n=1 Tax=Oceanobacillus sp. Castelsardo TaxID=1851204 RepID=UPI000837C330|nr:hypothetical protein [Oceanobacillus sp. Castelsardo]